VEGKYRFPEFRFSEVRTMIRTVLSALALALALAAVPATAEAGWPNYCGYNNHFYGLWGNPYVYSQGSAYIPPYYAIHPPVYYSPIITARPYGASPYAWGPTYTSGMRVAAASAPPAALPGPQMIENPHVKGAAPPAPAAAKSFLPIDNPFYVAK
jgi:hypothetical protein